MQQNCGHHAGAGSASSQCLKKEMKQMTMIVEEKP
jgi:hypothetical protein